LQIGWDEACRDFEVIVGQRIGKMEALPLWRRLRPGHKLVYEIDDDLTSIDPTNMVAFVAHGDVEQDASWAAIEIAHMVTVTTEPLAEVIRQRNPNVAVIPNHVDARAFDIKRPQRDRVTIGWAGGDSHLRDISMVSQQLQRFFRRNPQIDFHTIGTNFHQICKLPGRHSGWEPDLFGYYNSIDFDIGIAPLAPTVFNRSKSSIKAQEYGALGIPCVASDWPPYSDYIVDGVTGYLIRHEWEWGQRLYELSHDSAMRQEMGAAAKKLAATRIIQDDGWKLWEAAYASL
jgi:glycosyltransferase involved in cell wall biosynthesis